MIDYRPINGSSGTNNTGDAEVHEYGRYEIGEIKEAPDETKQAKEEEDE